MGHLIGPPKEKSIREQSDAAYAEKTGSAPAEAPVKPSFAKPKRAPVWKSGASTTPEVAQEPLLPAASAASKNTLTPSDLQALQAALNKSVTASVRESLQASLHAELADVKRQLRSSEENAAIRRKQDEGRHQALLLQLESAKDGLGEAQESRLAAPISHDNRTKVGFAGPYAPIPV